MPRRQGEGRTLRLTETAESTPGRYQVEVCLEGDGPRVTATVPLELALSAQDRERIRWYGDRATDMIQQAHALLAAIDRALAPTPPT